MPLENIDQLSEPGSQQFFIAIHVLQTGVHMFSHAFLSSIGAASDEEQAAVVSTCSYNKKGPQSNTVKKRVLHVMVMGFNCH